MGCLGVRRLGWCELPWECAVSSDLSIFQKKLEIQIVCVCVICKCWRLI